MHCEQVLSGDVMVFTKEWYEKNNHPNLGKKFDKGRLEKMSNVMKGKFAGKKNPMYGKRHSKSALKKMRGRRWSDEQRLLYSERKTKMYEDGVLVSWNKGNHNYGVGKTNNFYGKKHNEKTKIINGLKSSLRNSGKGNPRWKGGVSLCPYASGWTNFLKEKIRNDFERVCVLSLEPENGRKLCVHHIDGDKDNHSPDNLLPMQNWVHMVLHGNEEFFEGTPYWKPKKGARG
jgi:hypothetical protein